MDDAAKVKCTQELLIKYFMPLSGIIYSVGCSVFTERSQILACVLYRKACSFRGGRSRPLDAMKCVLSHKKRCCVKVLIRDYLAKANLDKMSNDWDVKQGKEYDSNLVSKIEHEDTGNISIRNWRSLQTSAGCKLKAEDVRIQLALRII